MKKVEEKSKYILIADAIAALIGSGKLGSGDRAPSESEIISQYNVSNTTARKALDELERNGLISRVKGRGSFVLATGAVLTRAIGSFGAIAASFAENLRKDGFAPRIKIVEQSIFNGRENIEIGKKFYGLNGRIYKIRVFRYAGKILLKDETRYIDAALCKGIENMGDIDPFIATLDRRFGLKIEKVDRSFTGAVSDKKAGVDFGLGRALIVLEGASITANGKVVEIEKSFYRADKYKFSVESKS